MLLALSIVLCCNPEPADSCWVCCCTAAFAASRSEPKELKSRPAT